MLKNEDAIKKTPFAMILKLVDRKLKSFVTVWLV